jgi:Fic family protein
MGSLSSMSYHPQFTVTPALLARVEQIAALRERILAATVQVAWIPALQKETRTRNTHASTAIEGNPLTLEQVRAVEEGREIPAVAQRAKREVTNYFAGLRFIETESGKKSNWVRCFWRGKICLEGFVGAAASREWRPGAGRGGQGWRSSF